MRFAPKGGSVNSRQPYAYGPQVFVRGIVTPGIRCSGGAALRCTHSFSISVLIPLVTAPVMEGGEEIVEGLVFGPEITQEVAGEGDALGGHEFLNRRMACVSGLPREIG
jgi:hypothetical protein